jgi:hypothetical protein
MCPRCRRAFGLLLRRHHCRQCGGIFCDRCSSRVWPLPAAPKRVCEGCYQGLVAGHVAVAEAVTVRAAAAAAAAPARPSPRPHDALDDMDGACQR